MADNFASGNDGYVKLGSLTYQFNKWRIGIEGGNKKFLAFGSKAQRTLSGAYAGAITLEGNYDAGNMPMTVGTLYEVHLGFAPGYELVVNARLGSLEFSNETTEGSEPGAKVSATFDSHGEFSVAYT